MTSGTNSPLSLWLLHEDEIDAWRAGQSPLARQWLAEQNFKGEKHRVVLLPDAGGGVAAAVAGLGKRLGEFRCGMRQDCAKGCRRAVSASRRNSAAAEATQLALGFAYGTYRFDRYRASQERDGESRAARQCRYGVRDPCRRVAAHGARLDQHAGRRFRSGAAGCCGAAGCRSPSCGVQGMGRSRICCPRIFRPFTRSDAPAAEAPRLVELRWTPPEGAAYPLVTLVGKGVCFDSGGLDIKPSSGMALMKKDMGGAAVALALAHLAHERDGSAPRSAFWCRRWRMRSAAMPTGPAMCSPPARD